MNSQYGLLLSEKDILLQRKYFEEMCKLVGVKVQHRAPRSDKSYTTYSEIDSRYYEPETIACIFEEHPNPKTMKRLGWNAELDTNFAIISVPYDLKGLQQHSLFIIPSAYDNTDGRLFRAVELSTIMIYPCSITCKLVPEYKNTFSINQFEHKNNSFNLLNREDE